MSIHLELLVGRYRLYYILVCPFDYWFHHQCCHSRHDPITIHYYFFSPFTSFWYSHAIHSLQLQPEERYRTSLKQLSFLLFVWSIFKLMTYLIGLSSTFNLCQKACAHANADSCCPSSSSASCFCSVLRRNRRRQIRKSCVLLLPHKSRNEIAHG